MICKFRIYIYIYKKGKLIKCEFYEFNFWNFDAIE